MSLRSSPLLNPHPPSTARAWWQCLTVWSWWKQVRRMKRTCSYGPMGHAWERVSEEGERASERGRKGFGKGTRWRDTTTQPYLAETTKPTALCVGRLSNANDNIIVALCLRVIECNVGWENKDRERTASGSKWGRPYFDPKSTWNWYLK